MNKNLLAVIGVLVIGVFLYMMYAGKQQSAPVSTNIEEAASPSATATSEVMVNLASQNSTESGTATLTEVDGKVKVTLKLVGAPMGVAQPAHIHSGACPEVGAVLHPLTSAMDGMSETVLDTTLAELTAGLPLGINVHKSAAESKVYVSCGDLKL